MTALQNAPAPRARELTAEEAEERVKHCFDLHTSVIAGLRAGRVALWDTAAALHEFDEERGWSALGGYDTLGDWLADPEIGMTKSTYYRLVGSYRELVINRQLSQEAVKDLDVSKVALVLPAIKAGTVTADEGLSDAQEMGWRDLREHYSKRPDGGSSAGAGTPGAEATSALGAQDGGGEDDDDEVFVPPPVNDGTDNEPVLASEAVAPTEVDVIDEPAQKSDPPTSGQVRIEVAAACVLCDKADGGAELLLNVHPSCWATMTPRDDLLPLVNEMRKALALTRGQNGAYLEKTVTEFFRRWDGVEEEDES